jgi:dolichol-phosphate mannosyltransferase
MTRSPLDYSVIIPIFNEEENIPYIVEELESVMERYNNLWELVLVDDGSTDNTQGVIQHLLQSKPFMRCIKLKKNSGQTSAFIAGVKNARGNWILSLDGDGQNDPQDIPRLIDACRNGVTEYDLVTGIRQKRQDLFYKRFIGKAANYIRGLILNDKVSDTGCSLKIYRKKSLEEIPVFNGMHRFLPALFQIEGFRYTQIPVNHRQRKCGKSKYHLFNRGISLFFDLLAVSWMQKRRLSYEVEKELP